MAFLEWEVFFLGTARTIGGNKSHNERNVGTVIAGSAKPLMPANKGVMDAALSASAMVELVV